MMMNGLCLGLLKFCIINNLFLVLVLYKNKPAYIEVDVNVLLTKINIVFLHTGK